jgi:OOP family OmpA-OmpF porin
MRQFVGGTYNDCMASSGHFATSPEAIPPIRKERIMKRILALATFAALCAAQPALAADKTGFYVGGDIANTNYDVDQGTFDSILLGGFESEGFDVVSADSETDDSDSSWGLFVGYRFMPYLAVEGGYMDLGTAGYQANVELDDGEFLYDTTISADISSSGFQLSGLGIFPVGESFEAYARLGFYFGDTDIDANVSVDGESESLSEEEGETEFLWGIGGAWNFSDAWAVRLEYSQVMDVGDEELTGEYDVDRWSLGVTWTF